MPKNVKISIDAMGGDNAPEIVIDAVSMAINQYSDIEFIIFGNQEIVAPLLDEYKITDKVNFIHSDSVVKSCEQPAKAFKTGKNSSMYKAIECVKNSEADACLSAGNTGALMVMSKMILGNIKNISRPAIIALMPDKKHNFIMLDLGANSENTAAQLYQFAIMGSCVAKVFLQNENPSVGLLNIGSEKSKGRDLERDTHDLLSNSPLNFKGNIEGHSLLNGDVDVILCDGYTGNISLKIIEGTASLCKEYLKEAFQSSFLSKLGYLLAKRSIDKTFKKLDPRYYNGAMFGGVEGIIVKSHGSCDAIAFNNAIKNTYLLAKNNVLESIKSELQHYEEEGLLNNSFLDKLKKKSAAFLGMSNDKDGE